MPEMPNYSFRLQWSPEGGEYVGLCAEFPTLSWLATTPPEALTGIIAVVAETIDDLRAAGEPIPQPIADRTYSGKLALRIPPELHRRLALAAAEQGVSLNRLISSRLSAGTEAVGRGSTA